IDRFNRSSLSFTHFGVDRDDGTNENSYCVALGFTSPAELWFLDTKTKAVRILNTGSGKTKFVASFNTSQALFYKNSSGQEVHLWSAYDKGTIHQVYKHNKLVKQESFFDGKNETRAEPGLVVIHVLQQNDSTVWLSTNKGLVKLNPLSHQFEVFDSWQGQTVRELRYTVISGKDELWAATGPDGIYLFDIKSKQFVNNFRSNEFDPSAICSNNIVSLYLDKMENLWCGSFGSGISYTNTNSSFFTSHISKEETSGWKSNNYITLLGSDLQGNLWCTFQNLVGIGLMDKNFKVRKYQTPVTENGTPYDQAIYKLLFETNDEAWMATNKGLFRVNMKTNKMRVVSYPLITEEVQGSIWIKDMIRLRDGSVLFSTYAGLYHMKNTAGNPEIKAINFLKPGVYNGFGKLVQDEKGLLYVKSLGDFIYVLRLLPGNNFELVRSIDFMPEINQFFNDQNDSLMYIASDAGLYSINTNTLSLKKHMFDERMPFTNINSFFRKDEKFWLFGEKGLYCYDINNNRSRTFTMEDGLPANDFTPSALVYDNKGKCGAGTSNGLVSFFPSDVQFITNTPRARLTAFYINDVLDTLHANPDEIKAISLRAKQNTFSLDFSPVSFFHTADCSFEYKLEGYDDNWIKSGATKYTRYSKIPPGNYSFILRVLDNQGNLSAYDKVLEIDIAKSFWQTNFFKTSLFLVVLFAGWLFLKWYSNEKMKKQKRELEKLQAIEKERTRIATDMHDDLGAGLSRIKFLSETIGIKKQRQESFEEDIGKIREYSHEMIDKMGEIVWALNEKNDSLSDLLSYTRSYAVEYLSQNGIACTVRAPEFFPTTFVSGEFRRNVYLTVKEALHNIVKHAQASSVIIIVDINSKLKIEIQDNGKGFDKNRIREFSNGLSNMESRINGINGKFEILNGLGTTIRIMIPLPA
ncbi:MAG TPA: triple tyrosine motif-containing protein, partial [Chitinophagaceae bacterium]|nr:triple tyrosine motif-containing protein [Chitinophagaceae bacterium]